MPVLSMQILSAGLEMGINKALGWAHNRDELLLPLANKTCIIYTHELENALIFDFTSDGIQVRVDQDGLYKEIPEDEQNNEAGLADNECWVSVSLFALDQLKQRNQLTKLIKTGKLDFSGDLSILQAVSALFDKLDLSFEEVLSQYIGDVAAYQLNNGAQQFAEHAKKQLDLLRSTFADAALDEKPIAVRKIMLINFCDEVSALADDVDRIESRITRLEKMHVRSNKNENKGV